MRTEFISKHARVIAEDIMSYCQLYLLEHMKNVTDYLDIVKKNAFDMFNNDDIDGFTVKKVEKNASSDEQARKMEF